MPTSLRHRKPCIIGCNVTGLPAGVNIVSNGKSMRVTYNHIKIQIMIKEFEKLTMEERALYCSPGLVSVLAASGDQAIDKAGKADAIKLAHLKIVTADAALLPYYKRCI